MSVVDQHFHIAHLHILLSWKNHGRNSVIHRGITHPTTKLISRHSTKSSSSSVILVSKGIDFAIWRSIWFTFQYCIDQYGIFGWCRDARQFIIKSGIRVSLTLPQCKGIAYEVRILPRHRMWFLFAHPHARRKPKLLDYWWSNSNRKPYLYNRLSSKRVYQILRQLCGGICNWSGISNFGQCWLQWFYSTTSKSLVSTTKGQR